MSSPPLNGVIEGFYGRPWTPKQRLELFSLMEAWGLNTYLYAPKDDLKHRAAWRAPYSDEEAAELRTLVSACEGRGVRFVYAIAPGLDVGYSSPADWDALKTKTDQMIHLGVKQFAILFDDIPERMSNEDAAAFGSFAAAQCSLTNRLFEYTLERLGDAPFLFCPTEYCARFAKPSVTASPYLKELGETLHPDIHVFWTGPEVVSETITVESVQELSAVLKRKPLLWDNLHANDYDIERVYLGPCAGRALELRGEVTGILSNPNNEFEANFIPLQTLARYLGSDAWSSETAYEEALRAWLPSFKTHDGAFGFDELKRLTDLLHLPFSFGDYGSALLEEAKTAASPEPGDAAARLKGYEREVRALLEKLTTLTDRGLLYALYPYLLATLQEVMVTAGYAAWRGSSPPSEPFHESKWVSNTHALGLVARLRRLLPLE